VYVREALAVRATPIIPRPGLCNLTEMEKIDLASSGLDVGSVDDHGCDVESDNQKSGRDELQSDSGDK
jgi:hypothetical protein